MFQKIAKHRANDASNDVHRPPLCPALYLNFCVSGNGEMVTPHQISTLLMNYTKAYRPFTKIKAYKGSILNPGHQVPNSTAPY